MIFLERLFYRKLLLHGLLFAAGTTWTASLAYAQTPVVPIIQPHQTFVNAAGAPCAGCSLFSYAAGTTTPLATFTDSTGTSQNTNPLVLGTDGGPSLPGGGPGAIWLGTNSYKLVLQDTNGTVIWTVDNVSAAKGFPCSTANSIQTANSSSSGLTCDPTITVNTSNHTINIGTLPTNHVTIGALGTPTSWTLDTTSPATALSSLQIGVISFGAKCDGVTNDTNAFQAASNAAQTAYNADPGHGVRTIVIPSGTCVVAGQVQVYSGQRWTGQGTILVPTQTGHTFYAQNADNVTFDGISITVTTPMAGSPAGSAIAWYAVSDSAAHTGFYVRHCNIINSSWGIFAVYNGGTGSLTNVDIANNNVTSNTIYTNGDGIHVAGSISNVTIHDNRVYGRGDAGIGLTSEIIGSTFYQLSGVKVSNNVLLEDLVGLDNSGATNVEYSGNYVRALTAAPGQQNPAFRSIYYPPNITVNAYPTNVHVFNNYFYSGNNSGVATTAKFDPIIAGQASWPALNSSFEKNVIDGPNAPLYIRGKALSVGDNTFITGGQFQVDYDGSDNVGTANVVLGTNKWLAAGSIVFGAGCALYSNISLQPQASFAGVTYTNLGCIGTQTFTLPGNLNTANIFAPSASPLVVIPGAASLNSFVVTNPGNTVNWFIVDNAGNVNVPVGTLNANGGLTATSIKSAAMAGTGKALACFDALGNVYRGTATTCP